MFRAMTINRQVNKAVRAAEMAPASGNSTSVAIDYDRGHGRTRLIMDTITVPFGPTMPVFDLKYAHTDSAGDLPVATSLADRSPSSTTFRHTGVFETLATASKVIVDVNRHALTHRNGLLPLAHELAHTRQFPLLHNVVELAAGVTTAVDHSTERYTPAFGAITAYAQNNAQFAEDYATVAREWNTESDGVTPFWHVREGSRLPLMVAEHREASVALNALAEVDAWKRAFDDIEAGNLHPGMDQITMHEVARGALNGYDRAYDTTLHVDTFDYAFGTKA